MTIGKWSIKIHNNKYIWYKYIKPRRLTLDSNPTIYRWIFFTIGNQDEIQKDAEDTNRWSNKKYEKEYKGE